MVDLEAQKTIKSVCWQVTDGPTVQCENKNDCESERGSYHQTCVDFNEWQNDLKKKVEKYLKVKMKKKKSKN